MDTVVEACVEEYEKRIRALEEAGREKAREIAALKGAVVRLSRVLDDFKKNKVLNAVHSKTG